MKRFALVGSPDGLAKQDIAPTVFTQKEYLDMPLFDRKPKKISYSLSRTAKQWIIVFTSLVLFLGFVSWFLQPVRSSIREKMDFPSFLSFLLGLGLIVGCAALNGIRVTDRTDDRDS
jgi:hypothetical protein